MRSAAETLGAPPRTSQTEDPDDLERELRAAHRAGLRAVTRLDRGPLPHFDWGPCLRFPNQARLHALQYLNGLVAPIEHLKGRIHTGTHVVRFEDGTPAAVETADGLRVTAQAIVVATNTPVNDRVTIHTKQAAYRTYVVGLQIENSAVPDALYWDTGDPYHYARLVTTHDAGTTLIVGGEDHKTGQNEGDPEARFERLESWARARFPSTGKRTHSWSGQVMEPIDSLAFIGLNPGDERIYIATGDSGNGMTHGTIAALLLTDLIQGRSNSWRTLYDPARKTLRAAAEFAKENLNVARQYSSLVTAGEIDSAEALAPGQGAVIREGVHKIAAYRDQQDMLHRCSAVCPHLGCIVGWNVAESSWDCPCHGSRFDATGRLLNGPANTDLHRAS